MVDWFTFSATCHSWHCLWSHVCCFFIQTLPRNIVCRQYKPCEFLGLVWTDCWGNKSDYDITSPANRLIILFTRKQFQVFKIAKFEFKVTVHNGIWVKNIQLWPRLAGQSLYKIETGAARLTQWLIFKVSFWTALITKKVKNTLYHTFQTCLCPGQYGFQGKVNNKFYDWRSYLCKQSQKLTKKRNDQSTNFEFFQSTNTSVDARKYCLL